MKTVYFNVHDGLVFSEDSIAGEEALSKGRAFKALAPDNIESWRLSYDVVTKVVNVYGGIEKNEEQAIAQKKEEVAQSFDAERETAELLRKNNEKIEALAKETRKQLLAAKIAENPDIVNLLGRKRPE